MEKYHEHEVVIVGAGIAGLATAVALKIVGLPSLVLERSPELRAAGAALTLFPNAWRALEALRVAHKLIPLYPAVNTARVTDLSSGSTKVVPFNKTERGDTGTRSVHRKALLQALAEELPPDNIRFSSRIVSIDQEQGSSPTTTVHLDDGSVIKAKVLIGCDGVHSVVARWLGLSPAVDSGRSAIRGLAVFPEGHGLKNEVLQFLGDGKRGGVVPLNNKELYWFITRASDDTDKEMARATPELIMEEVQRHLTEDFPPELRCALEHADASTVSWAPLLLRVPWDLLLQRTQKGCVTVAGDAMHPMTPEIGQGGCAALEDAVVLGRCLARAPLLEAGLENYARERRWRVAGIVAAAYLSGWVQQGGSNGLWRPVAKWFRQTVYYQYVHPRIVAAIRGYDCGDLPPAE
ncbi:monooxygenase 2-like [Zingiber officinale]|uniref:monooxygenase 2-like n=1 Tax=Zingiber officinale TaxID=94328 RepID=UPI001C4B3419|nr:monooxygenase 2-like [Zingiber officinale]